MKVDSLLLNSVAPSTRRVYDRAMVSYLEFCEQYSIEDKYSSHTIELFVAHLANKGIKPNSIRSTLSGIRHHCNINSIKFEHNTPRIAMMLRGVGRSAETSTRSKNALRIRHLQKMCNATVQLFEHKIATMLRSLFTLSFFAMLRPSEMLYTSTSPQHQLQRSAVRLKQDKVKLTFSSYKHSDGPVTINIGRQDCGVCPVRMLTDYLSQFQGDANDPLYPHSVGEVCNWMQQCLAFSGVKTVLTLHSFRRGGATWYSEHGFPNAKLAALGRWKSNAYLKYVKP